MAATSTTARAAPCYSYGTHKDTEVRAVCNGTICTGNEKVFGQNGWYDGPVVGPGAGTAVPIGENWYRQGLGPCPFSGNSEACIEDGSYVKLRELSLGYTFDTEWVRRANRPNEHRPAGRGSQSRDVDGLHRL